uniref:Uncharacterized protein n=1 Tax=Acrobeloides nanus TaxID=290746 RepID=A0A914DGC9_9BILA
MGNFQILDFIWREFSPLVYYGCARSATALSGEKLQQLSHAIALDIKNEIVGNLRNEMHDIKRTTINVLTDKIEKVKGG